MSPPDPSDLNDPFLSQLQDLSKFKQRSHDTHHNVHLHELNTRLSLGLDLPLASSNVAQVEEDPFDPTPDFSNKNPINVIYLGNSMLERLKTTGENTKLAKLDVAWNAGCGGDKNENVIYRLEQGLYAILKTAQEGSSGRCDIKLWVLASGTNNLHPKRGLREKDIESWKALVEACLKIAPESMVLACVVFYRQDIENRLVDEGNEMMKKAVEELNRQMGNERVKWVEARYLISKEMLDDHVHLNEKGYAVWDGVLWGYVAEALGVEREEESST